MRFAVIGVGGAGGYFGARLVQAGLEVAFIARGEHLAVIRARGLRVESVQGETVARPAMVTDDPREVGAVDYVLVGVKAWQLPEAARAIGPLVGSSTRVLPLQNGVEAPEQIAAAVGGEHALGGVAKIISFLVGPGHIEHIGADPTLEVGELGGIVTPRIVALRQAFERVPGATLVVSPDVRATMWAKFLLIAPWSSVGAMTRAPLGTILGDAEPRALLEAMMREIEALARAREVRLDPRVVAGTLAYLESLPPQGTASMQRDFMAGKPSELESLCGAVVRLGAGAGVSTPVSTVIYDALVPLERRARGYDMTP